MDKDAIKKVLVEKGKEFFKRSNQLVSFIDNHTDKSEQDNANKLLNDLKNYPHAFVLACVMDRQIKADRAWFVPYQIMKRNGNDFSMESLKNLTEKEIFELMSKPEPVHRFTKIMSNLFYLAIQRIWKSYKGDASAIWKGKPSSAEAVYRFLEFNGVGPKIATMATNILARDFKIEFSDYYSIDISADVHVKKVFYRLGLCEENPTVEQVIYKARSLYPEFPGVMDLPCWEIGQKWCGSKNPQCKDCYMNNLCGYSKSQLQ